MKNHLLASFSPPTGREIPFLPGLGLTPGRLHEFCGFSRRMLAVILALAMDGPVFWLRPARQVEHLHGDALAALGGPAFPARFTFVTPRRDLDLLWSMEEILRAGIVPLVICELPAIPGLTPVRRLHLAARNGADRPGERRFQQDIQKNGQKNGQKNRQENRAPLGVILLAGAGGAPGVESRWHMAPEPVAPMPVAPDSPADAAPAETVSWRLERRRARMQPLRGWTLRRRGRDFTLGPARQQDDPAAGPGIEGMRGRPPSALVAGKA